MAVCQFFLRGQCRFGEQCRNEHPRNTGSHNQTWTAPGGAAGRNLQTPKVTFSADTIKKDLTPGDDKPLWPLSSYGPGKGEATLIQGLDESPEELRFMAWQALKSGDPAQAEAYKTYELNKISAASTVHKGGHDRPEEAFQAAYRAVAAPPSTSISAFGTSSQPLSNFGQPSTFSQPAAVSAFGQSSQSSAFGQPSKPSSPFGQAVQPTPAFGQLSFSQPTSAFSQSTPSSVFGQSAKMSAFGQPVKPTSAFGQPAFGSSQPSQLVPAFGQSAFASAPSSTKSSVFGQSSFGQPTFGQTSQPTSAFSQVLQPTSAFGQPSSSTFGQPSQPTSAFGQSSQPASTFGQVPKPTSAFDQPAQPSAFGGGTSSAFGAAPALGRSGGTGAFGGTAGTSIDGGFGLFANTGQPNTFGPPDAAPQSAFGSGGTGSAFGSKTAPTPAQSTFNVGGTGSAFGTAGASATAASSSSTLPSASSMSTSAFSASQVQPQASSVAPTVPDFAKMGSSFDPASDPYLSKLPPNYVDILPKSALEAFESAEFQWARVPEWTPPLQMR